MTNINIVDKLFSDSFNIFDVDFENIPNDDFTSAVLRGGYPEVYNLPYIARKAWF